MSVERAMKLVMLASSPNEHEARTAAFLACKAIREGRLVLLHPDDPRLHARAESPPREQKTRDPEARAREEQKQRQAYQDAKARTKAKDRKLIELRFDGWCRSCRVGIPAGQEAWWASGEGVLCGRCYR
jgi:hypothetical protein